MGNPLEDLLKERGGCLSTELAKVLVDEYKLTPTAARQRVSRGTPNIKRLAYLPFARNARFLYLKQNFGSQKYWSSLIRALLDSSSAYGLVLAALQQRGGIIPEAHFPIACGAPLRQTRHLSPETLFKRLHQAGLVGNYDVPGVGPCVALLQGDGRYDGAAPRIRARMITENILLQAIRDWLKCLGLASFDKVALRGEGADLPKIGTFAWDLTAPSYVGPMVEWGVAGKPKPGFVACDVLLGSEISEDGLAPFVHKCETLRHLKNVGRCLQIFVAERYSGNAFKLAKQSGIVPATPDSLFGTEVAEALGKLTQVLIQAAAFAIDPKVFNEVFLRLSKIEGATSNLRGALFEFIVAAVVRHDFSQDVRMNEILVHPDGAKVEIDVLARDGYLKVLFAEAKGYPPFATVPDSEVEKWLTKTVPLASRIARERADLRNLEQRFEFWTTGKLSPEAAAMVEKAKQEIRPAKYTVAYLDAAAVRSRTRDTGDKELFSTLETHFLNHPMATAERAARNRFAEPPENLANRDPVSIDLGDEVFIAAELEEVVPGEFFDDEVLL